MGGVYLDPETARELAEELHTWADMQNKFNAFEKKYEKARP
jgi:hypothetical protein